MFRAANLKRWVIVAVAAYAMVLHALAMGVAQTPDVTGDNALTAALQQICSGIADEGKTVPSSAQTHSAPCALCGLGHAVLSSPEAVRVALPTNIIETIAQAPDNQPVHARPDIHDQARPRAPPAFV